MTVAQTTITRKATFLGPGRGRRANVTNAATSTKAAPPTPSRPPLPASPERLLRNLALAIWIERGIDNGTFVNYADAARRLGVSRARVSQLLRTPAIESPIIETITRLFGEIE